MKTMNRDNTRDIFHLAVLAALDTAARETFNPPRNAPGASDIDLPRLFRAIDEQVDVLAKRYGVTLIDVEAKCTP